ncbi:DoxX family protein [Maribacter halichondriae]|uniref:DoxX family protein n=1 Tax=Maribacter halichondriae TaxID=2980554 RepID=UPI00307666EF
MAFFRITMSILLLTHGFPKFQKLISGNFEFGDPIGIGAAPSLFLAVIGEFICPLLIIIGFKTRWAAIPSAITMMVAAFIVHSQDPFGTQRKGVVVFGFLYYHFPIRSGKI